MATNSILAKSTSTSIFKRNRLREALWGFSFIAPNFLIVLFFTVLPVFFSFYMSLTDWNIMSAPNFIGLENYRKILVDKLALTTFSNTLYFTAVSVPVGVFLSLILAVLLNQGIRGIGFFRTAYYLPVISASVAVSLIFMWILANNGLFNQMLESIGLHPVRWLTDPKFALNSVIGVTIWKGLGLNMIIFLAALPLPTVFQDHSSITLAGDLLCHHHRGDRFVPSVRPGLQHDQGRPGPCNYRDRILHLETGIRLSTYGVWRSSGIYRLPYHPNLYPRAMGSTQALGIFRGMSYAHTDPKIKPGILPNTDHQNGLDHYPGIRCSHNDCPLPLEPDHFLEERRKYL
jgi:hypothetical protein